MKAACTFLALLLGSTAVAGQIFPFECGPDEALLLPTATAGQFDDAPYVNIDIFNNLGNIQERNNAAFASTPPLSLGEHTKKLKMQMVAPQSSASSMLLAQKLVDGSLVKDIFLWVVGWTQSSAPPHRVFWSHAALDKETASYSSSYLASSPEVFDTTNTTVNLAFLWDFPGGRNLSDYMSVSDIIDQKLSAVVGFKGEGGAGIASTLQFAVVVACVEFATKSPTSSSGSSSVSSTLSGSTSTPSTLSTVSTSSSSGGTGGSGTGASTGFSSGTSVGTGSSTGTSLSSSSSSSLSTTGVRTVSPGDEATGSEGPELVIAFVVLGVCLLCVLTAAAFGVWRLRATRKSPQDSTSSFSSTQSEAPMVESHYSKTPADLDSAAVESDRYSKTPNFSDAKASEGASPYSKTPSDVSPNLKTPASPYAKTPGDPVEQQGSAGHYAKTPSSLKPREGAYAKTPADV